ncbi:hypothetical protein NDU88_002199 [Pleurodeles waltl]|uniref:Uncharacterized protein n=1 Tax=Pleurodeles waltl TaxID=8319 RepID=A0AAV7UY14_PLEWA|nr:hypothetical protein NDU88_002199 [Pleurodeles waltl]
MFFLGVRPVRSVGVNSRGGRSPSRPPSSSQCVFKFSPIGDQGGATSHSSSDFHISPPGSPRSSGHGHCLNLRRHLPRPSHPSAHQAGPGWVGHNAQYPSLEGNTCGPGSPAIPRFQSVEGPVGDLGDRRDPRRTCAARSGKAHGSTQGPRCRLRVSGSSVGTGSGILPCPPQGFTDPPGGNSRRPSVAARARPQQSGAPPVHPAGPVQHGVHPPGRGVPPAPRPPQQDEERQQGPQESGRPTRSFPSPMLGAFRRGPQLQVMAVAPLPRFRLLRGRRSLRAEASPKCPRVVNEIFTPVYLSLGCSRAQDLNLLVGRERSSSVKRPLPQPS